MSKRDLQRITHREMIKCEACNGLHDVNDTEVITVKIVKGKHCELKSPSFSPILMPTMITHPAERTVDTPPPVIINNTPEVPRQRRAIIPQHILSTMIPPGNPGSATETRIV